MPGESSCIFKLPSLCKANAHALKKKQMDGKYLISSKHSEETQPGSSISVSELTHVHHSFCFSVNIQ